jgi:hypothetical protein
MGTREEEPVTPEDLRYLLEAPFDASPRAPRHHPPQLGSARGIRVILSRMGHVDIGRRGRRRCPLLIALAALIGDAQIVLGVLIEIFRSNAVAANRGFPHEDDVPLEDLVGAAAGLDVGALLSRV